MRVEAYRAKGLQDIINPESQVKIFTKLARLQVEKERTIREKEIWQKRIALLDARLGQIVEMEKQLQQLIEEEDHALADRAGRRERSSRAIVHKAAPVNEVTTLRY